MASWGPKALLSLCFLFFNLFFIVVKYTYHGFPGDSNGKVSVCNVGDLGSIRVGKIPWRRKWQPTPVLLPRKFHRLRSLVGYSLWGCKESDTTEQLHFTSYIPPSRHFKLHNLVVLSTFILLCSHHHHPSRNCFRLAKLNLYPWNSTFPFPPPP